MQALTPPPAPIGQSPKPHKHIVTSAEILAAQPEDVQAIIQEHQPGTCWPTIRRDGTVFYPFDADASPMVYYVPLRTTGKRDKSLIAFGLLTNANGRPVAVEVFEGNTATPSR